MHRAWLTSCGQGLFQQTRHHHLTPGVSVCAADVDSAAHEEVEAIAQQAVDLILPLAPPAASAAPAEIAPAGRDDSDASEAASVSAGSSSTSSGGSQVLADQPVLQTEFDGQAVMATRQRGSTGGSSGGGGSSSTGSNNVNGTSGPDDS